MEEEDTKQSGVFSAFRRLASTILGLIHNRVELLVVELREERIRLVHVLLLVATIVALGLITLAAAATAALILVWDRFGVGGLFAASGLGLVATLLAYWWLRVRLKNWPFLSATLAELKKDRQCLDTRN
jgi:uncharacterized membrane protein YqjE